MGRTGTGGDPRHRYRPPVVVVAGIGGQPSRHRSTTGTFVIDTWPVIVFSAPAAVLKMARNLKILRFLTSKTRPYTLAILFSLDLQNIAKEKKDTFLARHIPSSGLYGFNTHCLRFIKFKAFIKRLFYLFGWNLSRHKISALASFCKGRIRNTAWTSTGKHTKLV